MNFTHSHVSGNVFPSTVLQALFIGLSNTDQPRNSTENVNEGGRNLVE